MPLVAWITADLGAAYDHTWILQQRERGRERRKLWRQSAKWTSEQHSSRLLQPYHHCFTNNRTFGSQTTPPLDVAVSRLGIIVHHVGIRTNLSYFESALASPCMLYKWQNNEQQSIRFHTWTIFIKKSMWFAKIVKLIMKKKRSNCIQNAWRRMTVGNKSPGLRRLDHISGYDRLIGITTRTLTDQNLFAWTGFGNVAMAADKAASSCRPSSLVQYQFNNCVGRLDKSSPLMSLEPKSKHKPTVKRCKHCTGAHWKLPTPNSSLTIEAYPWPMRKTLH